jgi:ComF family protein
MIRFLRDILDFVLPPLCSLCNRRLKDNEKLVCTDCLHRIRIISPPFCELCGKPVKSFNEKVCHRCAISPHKCSKIRAIGPYDGNLKNEPYTANLKHLIYLFKYSKKPALAKLLGKLMADTLKNDKTFEIPQVVVPVPLHKSRERERGYNQAKLLAEIVSSELNLPLITDALVRIRATQSQTKLSAKERKENVKGAFKVNLKDSIKGKKILLVDDVFTTGATLDECATELLESGALDVSAVTCASAV